MPSYLYQVAYTADGWKALVESPQDRMEAVKPAIEELDGSMIAGWLCFGEYDLIAIIDFPDDTAAAAWSMAVSAGGTIKSIRTTPLITTQDGVRAMEKAKASSYEPVRAGVPA
jgi:uncharacterized protein with GYD domain